MVYIRAGMKLKAKEWTLNYQRFRWARARIVKLSIEILRLINQLEKDRRKELEKQEERFKELPLWEQLVPFRV